VALMELLIRPIASSKQSAEAYRPPAAWVTEAEDDLRSTHTDHHLVIAIANQWRAYELRITREEAEQLIKKIRTAWEL